MWAIRILTGPQAGQIFPLKPGKNMVGRGSGCEIKINSNSVSKEHASVLVTEDKLLITDLNSRNGTFINGVRVQHQRLNLGDKLSLHDILLDVLKLPAGLSINQPIIPSGGVYTAPPPAWAGNAALNIHGHSQPSPAPTLQAHTGLDAQPHLADPMTEHIHAHADPYVQDHPNDAAGNPAPQMHSSSVADLLHNAKMYVDNVAMPGVYVLVRAMQFRYALAGLVGIYILIVTALSTIPMVSITKKSIQQESVRRAKTIARHLAAVNRKAVIEKNDMALSTQIAEREEGVTHAILLSANEGTIIAPANKRGEFAKLPFVNQARREERETSGFIDDSKLGVAVPITYYNPSSGNQVPAAYAIVLYDMGSLAMNSSQTLSLFIQTLAVSLLIGAILFFFLYKIVEHPIDVLNGQLDDALREGRDDLKTDYRFPSLERLISNINSALSRISHGGGMDAGFAPVVNREIEASNIVRMLPGAAVAVNAIDDRVIATNPAFDHLVGGGLNLQNRPLSDIPDPALQANLMDLLPRMRSSLADIALSEIPFFGNKFEICGQAVMGASEPAYFIITLNQLDAED